MRDLVLVLNFDDAASRAVARKLRSERVFCRIIAGQTPLSDIQSQDPLGLVLAGGVTGRFPQGMDPAIASCGLPLLALGDAAPLLLSLLGGQAGDPALQGAVIGLHYQDHPLLSGVEDGERLLQCARELTLPAGMSPICRAQEIIVGFAHDALPLYGMQFQVEQNDPEGSAILKNYALTICGCTPWWDEDAFLARAVEEIRRVVGGGRALCAMTGGLDSGVSALLAHKALGDQLQCIFVDTGLLRDQEGDDFMAFYRDTMGMNITRVYAQDRFLTALQGITDAEEKRDAIGGLIRQILREEQAKLGTFAVLIRGTSCNDLMNASFAPRFAPFMDLPVIEPVRDLFKDEIRRVGDVLGIPGDIISRQPFPGSGLALRVMGEVTPRRLKTLRAADAIFRSEVQRAGVAKRLWQYFAVLCPMPGDEEKAVICLRAVHANERSMAYAARLPYDVTENTVDRIQRELPDVCRVVYDLTPSSNYAGIEWQ